MSQTVETIVDFKPYIETKCKISGRNEYVKVKIKEKTKCYAKDAFRHGQQTHQEIENEVTTT